ncbi:hypothetical protein [uncultured Draconibacterium sp.]|uniref:hypothetical protein n=1 Tax=uncultured Draconibacterium sp. TaxID=1573823 RepID=UPI0032174A3D
MKKLKILLSIVFVSFLFTGCLYNFILPEEAPPVVDPDDPDAPEVSFVEVIEPIFNNSNYCTACHKTGGQAPDLTTGKAYAAINSARYINSATPEDSKIYTHPHPDTDTHKQKKYTSAQAAQILVWISQGAKNN